MHLAMLLESRAGSVTAQQHGPHARGDFHCTKAAHRHATLPLMKRKLAALSAAFILAINALVLSHAHALTHFNEGGPRTPMPEDLHGTDWARTLVLGASIPKPTNAPPPDGYEVGLVGELETWSSPGSPTVALFHGYTESKEQLLPVARFFRDRGFGVVLVDFAGHGGSGGEPRTTLGWREAEDVLAVAEAMQPELLYGFSMGSAAILRACSLGMRADGLILEAPFDTLVGTVRNRFRRMDLPPSPGAEWLTFWGSVAMGIPGHRHNPVDFARACPIPALVIGGSDDDSARPQEVAAVAEALDAPHLELAMGHQLGVRAAPGAWGEAVLDLADRASRAQPGISR